MKINMKIKKTTRRSQKQIKTHGNQSKSKCCRECRHVTNAAGNHHSMRTVHTYILYEHKTPHLYFLFRCLHQQGLINKSSCSWKRSQVDDTVNLSILFCVKVRYLIPIASQAWQATVRQREVKSGRPETHLSETPSPDTTIHPSKSSPFPTVSPQSALATTHCSPAQFDG